MAELKWWHARQLARGDAGQLSFFRWHKVPSLIPLDQLATVLKSRTADLLTVSSTEPTDQAIRISAWLEGITPLDREFVVEHVKRLCDQLRRRG